MMYAKFLGMSSCCIPICIKLHVCRGGQALKKPAKKHARSRGELLWWTALANFGYFARKKQRPDEARR